MLIHREQVDNIQPLERRVSYASNVNNPIMNNKSYRNDHQIDFLSSTSYAANQNVNRIPNNHLNKFAEYTHCSYKVEETGHIPPIQGLRSKQIINNSEISDTSPPSKREWVAVTAYQPVDIVTRKVEVPVTRTVDVYVPKPVYQKKIVQVPKYIPKYTEKVVEVPQVEWVERIVEVPEYIYNTQFVPKYEIRENVVEKPVFKEKWVERFVDVTVVEEVIRYRSVVEEEETIKYIPKGHVEEEWRGAPVYTVPPGNVPDIQTNRRNSEYQHNS